MSLILCFNPHDEGFEWPNTTEVVNFLGNSLAIAPAFLRPGITNAANDRERECFRLYDTSIGILTELEIKYWMVGGMDATKTLIDAYNRLFAANQPEMPVQDVVERLQEEGFAVMQIQIVIGWLIRGGYVSFDRNTLMIGASN